MFGFSSVAGTDVHAVASRTDKFHLIDVRTDSEFARGKLPNAQHLPLHLLPLRVHELPTDKPVVVYCQSGGRSAQACQFLHERGIRNAVNMEGGISAWMRAGLPVHAG